MSQNPSHLVPTPTVDKNGVLTTRHKKPENTAGIKANSIPQVTITPSAPSYAEGSNEHLADVIYGHAAPLYREAFRLMRDDDKTVIPLAIRLLTTGSERGKSEARLVIDNALASIYEAYDRSADDELWRDRCTPAWSPNVKHNLLAAWSLGNVLDETGLRPDFTYLMHDVKDFDEDLERVYGQNVYWRGLGEQDDHWRGLAAIAVTEIEPNSEEETQAFSRWAARHDDLPRVVNVAMERGTLDVTGLQAIMDEQDKLAAPLREGSL